MKLAQTTENRCALDIVSASIGLISNDIRIIWFRIENDTLKISFAVNLQSPSVVEDVEEIIFELEALNSDEITSEFELIEHSHEMAIPEGARLVYRDKTA